MTKKTTQEQKKVTKATTAPKKEEGTSLLLPNSTITITLKKDDVNKKYSSILASLAKKVSVPGFRKGNVPAKVAEEQLGQNQIVERVLDELVPAAYQETMEAAKKKPITHPEFSITSTEIGKDWVIKAHFAELPEVTVKGYEKHVKAGAKNAEKALAEAKKKANENKDKDTKEVSAPTAEQEKETKLQHIFRELVGQLKPGVPELLLKHETQHEFEHIVDQLKQLNMTVDDYLTRRNMTMDTLSQELAVSPLSRLQLDLLLGAIAKDQKLAVTDQDKDKYFETITDLKVREQVKKDKHYLGHLETNLLKQKVVDHLLSLA